MQDTAIGREVDGYRILGVLGRGGMGVVYKAEDVALARPVALKRVNPAQAHSDMLLHRFRAEAKALARINSPHIVNIYALRETDIGLLIVMEYVDGGTLKDATVVEPLPVVEAVRVLKQILKAFHDAHSAGVIHRDIKPHNILLTREGEVKITDFGIAKLRAPGTEETVTQGGQGGTLKYMSPEQIEFIDQVDYRSDLYSVGMTAYEMIAGRLPFGEEDSDFDIMRKIVEGRITPLKEFHPDTPAPLAAIIMKALARDPAHRYQDASSMLKALDAFASGSATPLWSASSPAGAAAETLVSILPPAPESSPTVSDLGGSTQPALTLPTRPPLQGSTLQGPTLQRPTHPQADELTQPHEPVAPEPVRSAPKVDPAAAGPAPGENATQADHATRVEQITRIVDATTLTDNLVESVAERPAGEADAAASEPLSGNGPDSADEGGRISGVLIGIALLCIIAGGYFAYTQLLGGRSASLSATTDPEGASVQVEGVMLGTTPLDDARIQTGAVALTISKDGYTPLDTVLQVQAAQAYELSNVRLTPKPAVLSVQTQPAGATLRIDGAAAGTTPVAEQSVKPGTHTLRIERAGYAAFDTVLQVQPGQVIALDHRLTQKAAPAAASASETPAASAPATPKAALDLAIVPSGAILIDGEPHATGTYEVAPGTHTIRFRHPQYGTQDTTLTIAAGQEVALASYFEQNVSITASGAWGNVWVNGENTGLSTPAELTLGPGTHRIEMRIERSETYVVEGGVHRMQIGEQRSATSFEGAAVTLQVNPSFEKRRHALAFTVSE